MALSAYFAVHLPSTLSDEQLLKVYTWGKENCLRSNMVMNADGSYILIAQKEEAKDLRSRQRLMLTNLRNWGVDTSQQPKGWARLLNKDEYDRISRNEAPAEPEGPREAELAAPSEPCSNNSEGAGQPSHQAIASVSKPLSSHHHANSCSLLQLPDNLLTTTVH